MTHDPVSAALAPAAVTVRHVAIVAVADFELLDVTGPLALFASATRDGSVDGPAAYRCRLVGAAAGPAVASIGTALTLDAGFADTDPAGFDTVVVAGGTGARRAAADPALLEWLRAAAGVRRIASVCTGAFLLAQASILAGRRATTHWRHAERLAADHPTVRVDADRIYLRDGNVWTSAGVTAGMDMALAMIADDLGRRAALELARSKVM